jgi:hypothetical protein
LHLARRDANEETGRHHLLVFVVLQITLECGLSLGPAGGVIPKVRIALMTPLPAALQFNSHEKSFGAGGGSAANAFISNMWPNSSEAGDLEKSGRPPAFATSAR